MFVDITYLDQISLEELYYYNLIINHYIICQIIRVPLNTHNIGVNYSLHINTPVAKSI